MVSQSTLYDLEDFERKGRIPSDIKEKYPDVHFCPEWDFMCIDMFSPEIKVCTCDFSDVPDVEQQIKLRKKQLHDEYFEYLESQEKSKREYVSPKYLKEKSGNTKGRYSSVVLEHSFPCIGN